MSDTESSYSESNEEEVSDASSPNTDVCDACEDDYNETDCAEKVCTICFENISESQMYNLECDHCFHVDCIVKNIQSGNISCPSCRKLPDHLTSVHESVDLRADIIDEYNKNEKQKFFRKAFKIVDGGNASNTLVKMIRQYKNLCNKNEEIRKYNDEVKKKNKLLDRELRKIYTEERKQIASLHRKFLKERKICKKKYKTKYKSDKYENLVSLYDKIVNYLGFRNVAY
jgi:hypothetical protein